jgi:long-chain acyl-CoA synthetase
VVCTCGNEPEFVFAYLGTLGCGAVFVPLNPASPPAELEREERVVGPSLVLDGGAVADLIGGDHDAAPVVDVDDSSTAVLLFTSGTAGTPRAAMLSHGNLCANVLQAEGFLGKDSLRTPGTLLTAIPLYHIFALSGNCMAFFRLGWTNLLIINPRDMPSLIADLKKHPCNYISGVNTLFNGMMHAPGFGELDFSALKITLGGGMAVQAAIAERWKQATGCVLTQGWGLTETSPAACICPVGAEFNGSIGLPISSTEIAIKDDAGTDLAVGQIGEICVRGPQVMQGYWRRPDETAKVMLPDGWLRTGDIGRMDAQGFVYIEDRKKDMILVSGFNVYPNEIEAVVAMHPGVLECAAIGVPDAKSGEAVKLFVVKKDPALTAESLLAHCREQLTGYKCPREVEFRSELPKSNVGKILRRDLRDEGRKKAA